MGRTTNLGDSGFTLLELLLSVSILAVILMIATTAMGSYSRILGRLTEDRANMHEVRLAMEEIYDMVSTQRNIRGLSLQVSNPPAYSGNRLYGTVDGYVYLLVDASGNAGTDPIIDSLYLDNDPDEPGDRYVLKTKNGEKIATHIESIVFEKVYGNQIGITDSVGNPIVMDDETGLIRVTVKANKNVGDDSGSCTVTTYISAQ
ncbi:MAG: type II secretion system protein [Bacillota bacterium]